ncbi:hypothetical protein [Scytonema sp. NUACC26]|uniref:hypothetical protein n=1 Tax=Scytonema sp. NUACC26 TaxID=3140176 RepID=UPI0038B41140
MKTAVTYRVEGRADAQVMRILDIPDAKRVITEQSLGRLYESAWLENVMEFME